MRNKMNNNDFLCVLYSVSKYNFMLGLPITSDKIEKKDRMSDTVHHILSSPLKVFKRRKIGCVFEQHSLQGNFFG